MFRLLSCIIFSLLCRDVFSLLCCGEISFFCCSSLPIKNCDAETQGIALSPLRPQWSRLFLSTRGVADNYAV
jgi:hypothetical protein